MAKSIMATSNAPKTNHSHQTTHNLKFVMFFSWELTGVTTVLLAGIVWLYSARASENIIPKNVITKVILYAEGILFMILSKDNKKLGPKYSSDPDTLLGSSKATVSTRTIVFMRHGESDWNDIFNKGLGLSMIKRLLYGFFRETMLMITMDSVFIDSNLNEDGFQQAKELSVFLSERPEKCDVEGDDLKALHDIINGNKGSSVVVSSNLRRAIATTTVSMWPRLQKNREKILILSSLQEISRNIDTKALAGRGLIPDLNRIGEHVHDKSSFKPEDVYDVSENLGNKSDYFNGVKRLKAFNDWAFKRTESTVIVGGHSLWFKHYFQTYLPHKIDHPAKSKKIVNTGVVAFTLQRWCDESGTVLGYRVEPESVRSIYGGYTTK
jgi:hypothetical protein